MKKQLFFIVAFIFALNISAQNWDEIIKKTASDGAANDQFGYSVSISGDKAIVGAPDDDDNGSNSGSAYVFSFVNNNWVEEAKLTASDGAADDYFGWSVTISGNRAVIGARLADGYIGAAYVFSFVNNSWVEEAKLTASDGTSGDYFGASSAFSGDRVIVGAYNANTFFGAAYIFNYVNNSWVQEAKLTASDGASSDNFGYSVAISGDKAIVGSLGDDDDGTDSGSAYIYNVASGSWIEEAKITATDAAQSDLFGWSVAISGDKAIVGANRNDDGGQDSGSAYVFSFVNNNWTQEAKLIASDDGPDKQFGNSVAIEGNKAIIGAHYDDVNATNSGSAYIFSFSNNIWQEVTKITPSDGAQFSYFGFDVDISGDKAIVGARFDAGIAPSSGSVYFFGELPPDSTPPVISGVTMESNNITNTLAKVGDQITLSFSADESINPPTVQIAGITSTTVTNTNGNNWTATITVAGNSAEGAATFLISNISDTATNTASNVDAVSSGSAVIIDNTAPAGYSVSIDQSPINAANNQAVSFTFAGAEVGSTYNYTLNSNNGGTPVIGTGTIATATDQISGIDLSGLSDGIITLSVTLTDTTGNTGGAVTDTESIDVTVPAGYSVSIDQSSIYAANDEAVSFTFIGAEIGSTYNYTLNSNNGGTPVTGTGTIATATDQISGIDLSGLSDGIITLSITLTDTAGNTGGAVTDTESKDATVPTGYSVSIDQSPINVGNNEAVSFTFAGAEVGLTYNYTLNSNNGGASVTGTGTIAAATDQISGIDLSGLSDGIITLSVTLTDTAGNTGGAVTDTESKDATAPVITLLLDNPQTIEVHSPYSELNATASDNIDGDISGNISIDISNVNMAFVGSYTVTYNVSDAAGNPATQVERTVDVVDTTKPVIALVGVNPQRIEYNEVYTELAATATDNYDDDIALTATISIDASAAVAGSSDGNTFGTLGTYPVYYNVTDANNNIADTATRDVIVEDTTKPLLTLIDDNPQIIEIIGGNTAVYVELGATASDEYDVDVDDTDIVIDASAVTNNLDTVGCYPVTYTVTDASGNTRIRTRIVFVLEPGKPWAKNDSHTVNQDSQNNMLTIIGNDSYGTDGANPNHPISISGTYTDNGAKIDLVGNQVQYTPRAGFTGVDTFGYTITDDNGDGSGDGSSATVTVTVTAATVNISAVADTANAVQGSNDVVVIDVLTNDTYGSANPHATEALTLNSPTATSTEGATLSVVNGKIGYVASATFAGPTDTFDYTIKDVNNVTSTATVTVTIGAADSVNGVPSAKADSFSVVQNTIMSLAVLANNGSGIDTYGTDGAHPTGALTFINGTTSSKSVKQIESGSTVNNIVVNGNVIEYTPVTGFTGSDSFYYMITDGSGDTSIAQVMITVTEVASPTANDDAATVAAGTTAVTTIDVLANDSFGSDGPGATPLAITNVNGSTSTLNIVNNKVTYIPDAALVDGATETIQYTITDGSGDIATAEITITIGAGASTNDTPTAKDDAVTVAQDSSDNVISILLDNGNGADDYGIDLANANHPISLSAFFTDNGGELELVGQTVLYTPRAGFTGVDSFGYIITDGNGDGSSATVNVTVTAATVNISAVADTANAVQGSNDVVIINVLANDTYGSAGAHPTQALTLNSPTATSTEGATLSVVNGKIGYVASATFAGSTDTFDYTIKDVNNVTSTATVTVTIGSADSVNGVPSAKADSFSVVQNTMTSLAVLANNGSGIDTYGTDGAHPTGALTFINGTTSSKSVKQIESGSTVNNIVVNGNVIEYTPVTGFTGSDSFYYMITDGSGDTSIAQVMITVTEVASPTANDDAATVAAGTTAVTTIDVLANDSFGSDGPGATPLAITNVNGSTSTLNIVNNKVTYIPEATLVDGNTETIQYTITDGSGDIETAEITITIGAGASTNDTPTAKDDAVTVAQDSSDNVISILLDNGNGADDYGIDLANANHPISLSAFFTDNGGELELVGQTVLYTPRAGFTGVDSFGYIITDGNGDGSSATVTVTVTAATVNISAVADTANAVQGSNDVVVIDVLTNDTYGSANPHATEALTLNSPTATSTEGATLSVVNGKIGYVASATFAGPTDTFDYTIKDVNNVTSTATVTVTIGAADSVNGVPSAKADSFSVVQNTIMSLAVLANNGSGIDTYGTDGAHPTGALTFINGTTSSKSVKQIESGSTVNNIVVNGNVIEYTPVTGFTGSDSFYYMITDGSGDTSIAQVMITVTEVASPTANDDAATVAAGTTAVTTIDVLANDSFGSDGPGATPLAITNVNGSTSTLNIVNNKVTYIPDATLVDGNTETIQYTITDGSGDIATAEITITIGAGASTNDTPTAKDDAVTVVANSIDNDIFILLNNGNGADDYGADGAHPNHPISPLPGATDIGGTLVLDGNKVVYTPKANFTGVDTFNYTITDGNGDSDTATVTITVAVAKNSTDDFNSSQIKELQVSPNPTSGNINVRLYSANSEQATIILFDVTGKVVYKSRQNLTEGNNTFNFNILSKSGILLLKVYTDKTNFGTKKVIIK
ncbi:Ig-like domain-containing protein [Polaribacter sp. Hel_I_88]|uniref:Ig-like domain-containing protein n=1 Tax=Polaribacter sp. Hel_I_88 TaxID=1250006 RepID=UPI0004798520|nr:Ig-like domain-containing protein [Polaribacter sp. Hel_I_88]